MNPGNIKFLRNVDGRDFLYQRSDNPYPNVWYYGTTGKANALTSEKVWEIKRVYQVPSGDIITKYASAGGFCHVWDDRESYFPTATPGTEDPFAITGIFTPSGLTIAGLITEVPINNTTWTPLPATPLVARNTICIQNQTATDLKLSYDPLKVGYIGIIISAGGERFYDIRDTIQIYAKAAAGTPTILIEEIS